jgi:hypothetical protein
MESKTTLEIIIENADFAKEFNYFITVQLDGHDDKRRTSVSSVSKTPKFTENKFYLPLKDYDLMINQRIIFTSYIVIDRPENNNSSQAKANDSSGVGQAKQLGENILDLAPLTASLTNINNYPVKQRLDLLRRQGDDNAVVGRLNITLKLLAEAIVPDDHLQEMSNDASPLLPELDQSRDFIWRLRSDIRSAVNLPFNRTTEGKLPSCYVEIGWTMYPQQDINQAEAVRSSAVDANRFPIWNQQLLFYPSTNVTTIDGYITVLLKDRFSIRPISKFTFPLNTLRPYHPVHLDVLLDCEESSESANRSHLYISFLLEDTPVLKMSESLVNVIVNGINFDPLPQCTNRCSVIMTTDKYKPDMSSGNSTGDTLGIYLQADLRSESHINNVLLLHKSYPYSVFMSNTIKIPAKSPGNPFGAITCFTIPRSFLDKNLNFFLALKDNKIISNHSMCNTSAGYIEVIYDLLKSSFFSKNHDIVPYKVMWSSESVIYTAISHSRCVVEMSVRPVEETEELKKLRKGENQGYKKDIDDIDYNQVKENIIKNAVDTFTLNLSNVPDKEKWDILSKELAQKQELIHRMMKEVDEKSDSLKLTGAEILELRKQIKLLQNENSILRKRLGQEEQMQIESLVTQEIHKMSLPELKSKIIKLAQNYRSERMRNEEFEKALKSAQNEISNSRKIAAELEELQKLHEEDSQKFLNLQKETQKISLYRETIKKQEQVIVKLENLLNKTMSDNNRQKESLMELETLRTENLKLQNELKNLVINTAPGVLGKGNPELEKYKRECARLEKIVNELRSDLNSKRPISSDKNQIQNELLELEVKYHKAQSRVRSLEDQLEETGRRYAQEISRLKIILNEKENLIETMRMENAI